MSRLPLTETVFTKPAAKELKESLNSLIRKLIDSLEAWSGKLVNTQGFLTKFEYFFLLELQLV